MFMAFDWTQKYETVRTVGFAFGGTHDFVVLGLTRFLSEGEASAGP
ncbi:MAG: hypothetical protein RMM53_10230 [Bacteroidia bacterium]|nr:hypothetical protein [Bacteroidia bacterium]